jgi:hypothetical protein
MAIRMREGLRESEKIPHPNAARLWEMPLSHWRWRRWASSASVSGRPAARWNHLPKVQE